MIGAVTASESTESVRQVLPETVADHAVPADQPRQLPLEILQGTEIAPPRIQEQIASSPVLSSIAEDEACNNFLQAFRLALQAQSLSAQDPRHWRANEGSLDRINRGLGILLRRLDNAHESCSDLTIQAVLVLFVYATKFQTPEEAGSHRAALEKMISLRGGLANFGHNAVLQEQLQRYRCGEVERILHIRSGPVSAS